MDAEQGNSAETSANLDRHFVGGVAWTAAAKWVSQLVSWPAVIIAARILSPSDFGIVDMAGFYFTLTNVLAEFGIGTAVVQLQELGRGTLRQLNTISVMFGVLACLLTVAVAPLLALFFHAPALTLLTRVSGVAFVMIGLQAVPMGLMQRKMDYRRISLVEAIQAITQAVGTIVGAFAGIGYWTFPVAQLIAKLVSLVVTLSWSPISFSWPTKEVFYPVGFASEIAFQRGAWMLYLQSDAIVVGRMMGQSILGSYRMAISLASAPADKISLLVMRVTSPLFAKIQNDLGMTNRYFLTITEALGLALIPVVAGLAFVARDAVGVLLGPRWSGVAVPLQWLAVFTVIRTMNSLAGQVLTALRYTRFNSWMVLINVLVMPATFLVASHSDAGLVAAGWVIMSPVTNLPTVLKVLKALKCPPQKYISSFAPALTATGAMLAGLFVTEHWWLVQWSPRMRLASEVVLGSLIYGGALMLFFRERVFRYVRFFSELRRSSDITPLLSQNSVAR